MEYLEALKVIETFNICSGIRDYCTNVCKGKCCNIPYAYCGKDDKQCKACNKRDRNIFCSLYLCNFLRNRLGDKEYGNVSSELNNQLYNQLFELNGNKFIDVYFGFRRWYHLRNQLVIPDSLITYFKTINLKLKHTLRGL